MGVSHSRHDGSKSEFSDEQKSFSELISREQQFLHALIRTIGVPPSDVQDILQNANLYLVQNQSKFEPGTNFRAWAAQVVRYCCLHYFRQVKKSRGLIDSDEVIEMLTVESVGYYEEIQPQLQRLKTCLSKISPPQFKLLYAVYGKGKTLKQVAEDYGRSHVAVRKAVSRIRMLLKECMTKPAE
ncbi:hypothetical protein DDZ13_05615 [Coraliomargarita sinensis]|uniref:RNA polymerase sigma-70 region 2 domain-containing protein n=1 Tax=Coraliomargarita sinensis TaxID=2174842 RepID=A0A317ZGT7_9BACT|nr:sigma-70 family RNA polymerase sigma factor [Coraliomargarita sinensis]PXA04650.1 hypothetical protein DDZ13_05615 [Coraliomargarita sinensis]